jgi:mannitol-1-phosphate 5-dehydrogenase
MSGYKVTFIDVNDKVISLLNKHKQYKVIVKASTCNDREIIVPNVRAISALDEPKAVRAIAKADILSVSVGKNALNKVLPLVAEAIRFRYETIPGSPLDIIIAENMINASDFIRERLQPGFSDKFPLDDYVGLVETSIGKMVPIMPEKEIEKDPLMVYAEPYNTLIVDKKGFRNDIPDVKGLSPKENIKAWVDRKAFIHNLGHATAAYYGHFKFPDAVFLSEVMEDKELTSFTKRVMQQSSDVLLKVYPADFTREDLNEHIEDLLLRFKNKALGDTIFRVGNDLIRKLGKGDRFMGVIEMARQENMPFDLILKAMSYGFLFKVSDEKGNYNPDDLLLLEELERDFQNAMVKYLNFS